jgi:hypothetical protein
MARPFIFQQIAETGKSLGYNTPRASYQAKEWFQKTARQVRSVNVDRLMTGTPSRHQGKLGAADIGHMFMFFYDAKHKDTLPYWDRFPLILPFHVANDHFKGFNLHYLSPYRRAQMMNELHKISMQPGLTDVQKMQISYQMLTSVARLSPLRNTIKMYLNSNVRSRFFWIRPDEWDVAIGLPTARFVGASATQVHRETARKSGLRSSRRIG